MKKVFVGLSGGVDSSVSALLLKKAGYEVVGVFIKGWQPDWIPCTWKTDRISAMRTAAYLEIPFVTLDLEMQYKNKVVDYILREYEAGNTPNPDMLCNREIKFGTFLDWAIKNGADFVATGHYAVCKDSRMYESKDKEKDQTYFLSQLTKEELSKIIFPAGDLEKKEVRILAEEAGLPVASRKDSQGICFVGDLEMKDFLKKELNPQKGDVLNRSGEIIGTHDGAILYTIGERHGFNILNQNNNATQMYVVSKDLINNTITVSDKENNTDFKQEEISIKEFSFTHDELSIGQKFFVRIRYRGEKIPCEILEIDIYNRSAIVKLEKMTTFASGQFAVFYNDNECLGGGVIC